MPMALTLTLVLIYIVAIVLAFWLIKRIIKVVIAIAIITLIFFALMGTLVYKDLVDVTFNVKDDIMVVLTENGDILSGFQVKGGEPQFFDRQQRAALAASYGEKDYAAMLGDNRRLFLMDMNGVIQVEEPEIRAGTSVFKGTDVITALGSPTVSDDVKGKITLALFTTYYLQSPGFEIDRIKDGTFDSYPRTASFKALSYAPLGLVKALAKKAAEKGSQAKNALTQRLTEEFKSMKEQQNASVSA